MHPSRRTVTRGLAASLAGLALPAVAAPASLAAPASRPSADPRTAQVQAALEALTAWPVVGAVGSFVAGGCVVEVAAGRRSAASPAPARPSSVARVASVTKAMTATVAFQEVERGTLRLDSTIGEVLPGLWPGREDVTLGQLLNHTSGMPDAIWVLLRHRGLWELPLEDVQAMVARRYGLRELVGIARQDPWWFEPGTAWGYSNTGYVVVQLMVEAVTGRPLGRLIRERVFRPAGMHRARLEDGTLVRGAEMEDAAVRPGETARFTTLDQSVFAGAAAVNATAGDVVRFYRALMQGRLVSQASVERMVTPVGAAVPAGYGYGIFSVPDPARPGALLYGHDGGGFGSASLALASRDGERAMAFTFVGRPYWEAGAAEVWDRQLAVFRAAVALPGGGVGSGRGAARGLGRAGMGSGRLG
ncbi:serine hydrolase [Micrococcus sp.]|uniref:serine hydrolase domain-containing protein n=1 Tax=Micrococcus sp. TaxID=1271 RepID=UPI0026DBD005|nr:serine hydrolase domain-containing protein [Micrococcus sp.]MDO4240645.1 serine hydrolase domain-containing protein [Micrococcus sp.]